MAFSLFGLMIIIWCSCGYLKMLSPWQPCKWTFWLIHALFLLKINLIHRKSMQVEICTIYFTVGTPCGLTHGYHWVKVILTLRISMWFSEKIDPLSDGPQNWCTLGNRNVFLKELQRFRGTSQTWLITERECFAICDWALTVSSPRKKLVLLDGTGSNPELGMLIGSIKNMWRKVKQTFLISVGYWHVTLATREIK